MVPVLEILILKTLQINYNELGYESKGNEVMYNALTGEQLKM